MEIPKVVGGIPEVRILDKASVIWGVASGAYSFAFSLQLL